MENRILIPTPPPLKRAIPLVSVIDLSVPLSARSSPTNSKIKVLQEVSLSPSRPISIKGLGFELLISYQAPVSN